MFKGLFRTRSLLATGLLALCVAIPLTATASVGSWIEINQGQAPIDVRAVARDGQTLLLLQADGARILMSGSTASPAFEADTNPPEYTGGLLLNWVLHGANKAAALEPGKKMTGISRYFKSKQADAWLDKIDHYQSIRFAEVYPGIDLVYRLRGARIEYDFVAERDADLSLIKMELLGARSTYLAENGDWVAKTSAGDIRQRAPEVFVLSDAGAQPVAGHFARRDDKIGFQVAASTADTAILIDPVIEFSGYLGGGAAERGFGAVQRANGNLILSGTTNSIDIPGTAAGTIISQQDIFVAELDRTTGSVLWINYLGGAGDDWSEEIKLDSQGNIVAVGYTESSDFPTVNAFQSIYAGVDSDEPSFNWDALVFKFSSDGSTLQFSTYYGGTDFSLSSPSGKFGFEWFRGIEIDAADNIYVLGQTGAIDFPVTTNFQGRGCLDNALGAVGFHISDITLVKFSADGTRQFATCIGGTERDAGRGLEIGPAGHLFVGGFSRSGDLPTTPGAFQLTPEFDYAAFVLKLNATMDDVEWGTFVGGDSVDIMQEIAVDDDGFVYGSGTTDSTNFPVTANAAQLLLNQSFNTAEPRNSDAFVFKLLPDGSDLAYASYFGGAGTDQATAHQIDQQGRIYFAGLTTSRNFPLTTPLQDFPGAFFGQPETLLGDLSITAMETGQMILPDSNFTTGIYLARNGISQFYSDDLGPDQLIDLGIVPGDTRDAVLTSNLGVKLINSFEPHRHFEPDFNNGGFVLQGVFGDGSRDSRAGTRVFLSSEDLVVANFGAANQIFVQATGAVVDIGRPDGRTVDVVALNFSNDVVFANESQDIRLYTYNFSSGNYNAPVILDANPNGVTSLATADLDGDNFGDLIIGRSGGPVQIIYFPFGNPTPAVELAGSGDNTLAITTGDVDQDQDIDLLIGNDGPDVLFLNEANVTLLKDSAFMPPDQATPALHIDFDNGVFLAAENSFQRYTVGGTDIHVSVINTITGLPEFSSYLDGGGLDTTFRGLSLSAGGKLTIAGTSNGSAWPVVGGSQPANAGDDDMVFIVIDTDIDDDGLIDGSDNCLQAANPEQRDSDIDGFGNFCDADFDNDNIVNFTDLQYFAERFFSADADADLDGDGMVNFTDLSILADLFFLPPGPSGLLLP